MQIKFMLYLLIFVVPMLTSCAISGRVVDSATEQPIEGAIVLAQWTKEHCFIDCGHELIKIAETMTSHDGTFKISGPKSLFLETPEVVIYKQSYVAWRNDNVFPIWQRKNDANLSNLVVRLEHFKSDYSHSKHEMFMSSGIMDVNFNSIPLFAAALSDEYEKGRPEIEKEKSASEEPNVINNCLRTLKAGAYRLGDICQWINYDVRKRQLMRSSDISSNIHKALQEMKIEVILKNDNVYLLKEKDKY